VAIDLRDGFDDNRSVWWTATPPLADLPALEGTARADLAIIGGGFTGMSTAYHYARRFPGKRVVLVEAKRVANGASGRNGGLMLTGVNGAHDGPPERQKRIYDATKEGIDLVAGIVEQHRLDVRMKRGGVLEVFTHPARAEAAARDVEALNAAGVPLRFLTGAALRAVLDARGVAGAVLDPAGGQLDGVSYLRALRPLLIELGVAIFEQTPVLKVEESREIRLVTPRGEVRAAAIVLATNAYTPALGYFENGIFPLHSHLVATEPRPAEAWSAAGISPELGGFSDDLDRLAYGGLTTDGRLVFGGGSNAAYSYRFGGGTRLAGQTPAAKRAIEKRIRAYFPGAHARITHAWSGPVALTLSRVCSMGVRGAYANVYYALGYSGHGITLANLAGKVLVDMMAGEGARWNDLPFYRQRLLPIPPEPLRFLGYHAYTALTGRSPRRTIPFAKLG
jgi:glycine/D-amino acid oxidase-like deaminating enzyme